MQFKKTFLRGVLALGGLACLAAQSQAAVYDCTVDPITSRNPRRLGAVLAKFSFDTATQDYTSVDAGNGVTAGCMVGRSKPAILSCYLLSGDKDFAEAVAEDGTSVLGVGTNIQSGAQLELICTTK